MKKRYIDELLWHISLFGCIYFFNRNRLLWCQLDLVDIICQKLVSTQTNKSVFIIRPVSNMSQVYKYQTVWEILTLGKRNKVEKRYINVLLYGIYLLLCVSGGTTRSQTMIWPLTFCIEVTCIISYNTYTGTWSNRPS
jgi:hypothetical protein